MQSLLFLTSVIPMVSGNGASMRVGMALEALARNYRVTLVVVSQNSAISEANIPQEMRELCARVWVRGITDGARNNIAGRIRSLPSGIQQLAQLLWFSPLELCWVPNAWKSELKEWLGEEPFERAHIFSLSMMQIAFGLLPAEVSVVLDLNDIESKALSRLAKLQRAILGRLTYAVKRGEAFKIGLAEKLAGARSSRVLVCSEEDRVELAMRLGQDKVAVMSNGIRLPESSTLRHRSGPLRILFVGSLDYAPNQDSVEMLSNGLAAHVSKAVPQGVSWRIVGRRPPANLVTTAEKAGLPLIQDAPSLTEHYEWADAVIVPLRSGGGTRIKILEALSWKLPVVSSTIGAEGLVLQPEQHLLIANTDDEYAEAFARLAADEVFATRLAQAGYAKVEESYSQEAISRELLAIYGGIDR
jgi:glycosyltransferase involved in cell wall biosynthesis